MTVISGKLNGIFSFFLSFELFSQLCNVFNSNINSNIML